MNMYYVDALAGMGKTTAAIKYAINQANNGNKVVIAQPTTLLLKQTMAGFAEAGYTGIINNINTENTKGLVKVAVMAHLTNASSGVGEILLVTHQTFMSLPHWNRKNEWDVIIDEIPSVYQEWVRNLDSNFTLLTNNIDVDLDNVLEGGYATATVKEGCFDVIQRMADSKHGDIVDQIFIDIAARLVNKEMWDTVVKVESYLKVINNESKGKDTIQAYSVIRSDYFGEFKSITVMGAMFKQSILFLLWKNSVDFTEHCEITSGLRSATHTNGDLLTIKYLYERNWSKQFRDTAEGGVSVLDNVKESMAILMNQKDFIYATNNDDQSGLDDMPKAIRLSTSSHGINEFQHINNAVFMAALNNTNSSFAFMNAFGITPDELTTAQYFQTMYQFVMRTSLRDHGDRSFKTVVVMDKRSAEYLQGYFPGCNVEAVDGMMLPQAKKRGRPAKTDALTSTERVARLRAKKKAEKLANK